MTLDNLVETFGSIDIYLFDQLLKGRITPGMKILDAGCGGGRNLVYFMQNGFQVFGVDHSAAAINEIQRLADNISELPNENFSLQLVEDLSFADGSFDVLLSSAVLHFARDEAHWNAMVSEMWRVLKPGGMLFARLSSTVGMENLVSHVEGRRFQLPDGPEWFLVDYEFLGMVTQELGGEWLEPFKTVVVHGKRAMSTWVIRKQVSDLL